MTQLATPLSVQSSGRGSILDWSKHTLADADAVLRAIIWTFDGVRRSGQRVA